VQWRVLLVALLAVSVPPQQAGPRPLRVDAHAFVDPDGRPVVLRGVASMGMAMVYGNKDRSGGGQPMSVSQYVDRATQTDATGGKWYSNAIRLSFERFPVTNPTRLYTTENTPYAMPDTVAFGEWQSNHTYADGEMVAWKGKRYRVAAKLWRADRGLAWNPTAYKVGDIVVNIERNIYRCTSSTGKGAPAGDWGRYPRGTAEGIVEDQGGVRYEWQYVGPFGQSGATSPFTQKAVSDNQVDWYLDNLVQWQYVSPDYSKEKAQENFADWKSKVMDPAVKRAVEIGLYVVITEFDFGPAHHPLRRARLLDFWTRMATSQWANHPQVLFELWNESEDIGSYKGGPGSWTLQKPVIQETVDAIRAAGAKNIIIVPTPFYSAWIGEATASPLSGANLAYALHQYRSQWESYSSNREQILQGLASGQAIVVTEWGDDTSETNPALMWPKATTVDPPLQRLLEPTDGSRGAAGWFAWALSHTWAPGLFRDEALMRPTPFGIATRQWLSEVREERKR
jgi:hypothetical protein